MPWPRPKYVSTDRDIASRGHYGATPRPAHIARRHLTKKESDHDKEREVTVRGMDRLFRWPTDTLRTSEEDSIKYRLFIYTLFEYS